MPTLKRRLGMFAVGAAMLGAAVAASPALAQAAPGAPVSAIPTELALVFEPGNQGSNFGPIRLQAGGDTNKDLQANMTFGLIRSPIPSSQKFVALPVPGTDRYTICSEANSIGLALSCLDITADSKSAGARIVLRPHDGTFSQQWEVRNFDSISPASQGVRNYWSKLFLDSSESPKAGSFVQLTQQPDATSEARQKWFIKKV